MAKKSVIVRAQRRKMKFREHYFLRFHYKNVLKRTILSKAAEQLEITRAIHKLPRDSSPRRLQNVCKLSGRSQGYHRKFDLSRHFVRQLAHRGILTGMKKARW